MIKKDQPAVNRIRGKILAVNISQKKGEKKHDIGSCLLVKDFGLDADAHGGSDIRQVSLLAVESIEKMRKEGIQVYYGDFAENLTTEGIDLHSLPVGTKLKIGNDVLLEVTQIGKICKDRCNIFFTVGDCIMPREGIFAKVLNGGNVTTGSIIEVVY